MDNTAPLILLAAGGTGGHLFPAEALGVELIRRGYRVRLATDSRALRYSGLFSKDTIDVVPSETVRGRTPWSLAYTGVMLAAGTVVSLNLMRRLKPAAVVGFGGYPTLPPLLAARMFGVPGIIHEANAVLGRANRFLSSRVSAIATSLPGVLDRDPALLARHRQRDAPGDPRRGRGQVTSPEATGPPPAGGRRQPGRAGDGRCRARRDRAAGAGAVEPADPHPAGARRRHGAGARGL
jgi:UDP-N-acetylglucosamine--N-acetylmuramyl-(pentapeptide) pyrophosphoryl-undecaprenol N-acetylglucosamine transferase